MKTATAAGSSAAALDFKRSIVMLARQVGHGIPAKAGFALWEWGTLWRECGSHK